MTLSTKLTELLGIDFPIIQAGMAGGTTTPSLVSAVCNAGGLGTLGAGYMSPLQMREAIKEIRQHTNRPFAVNLFIPEPIDEQALSKVQRVNQVMKKFRDQLGIVESQITKFTESFEDQLEVVLEEKVPIFSFTFGIPSTEILQALKRNQTIIIGTATTVNEAIELEARGVDAIVGQGSEAGGHRGTFGGEFEDSLIGTMALIPQMVDHVKVPVIASGGIMDGRGLLASLALGAEGVQMGTAFLTCPESGAHAEHKRAILGSNEQSTVLTRSFSGKPARGIKNKFISEMEQHAEIIPSYPVQNALSKDIRSAAGKQNQTDCMSLWAGQGVRLSKSKTAEEIVRDVVNQTIDLLGKIQSRN
ncbi:NAD(P)H-dependent flavin oxidoreductase [Ammoniphilus resinae]|uniref:Probable nitronate monooxygenase n=1 Tax=Ammoniphilus resinae TaxID=861532 RepID=A0ABS4GRV7_9BACL|nr:nitronate monooxygenase [Ammoniphilus resinae]MBP1933008.1 nitronate monooxygenase [Ammoniphilus resinae]